MEKKDYIEVLLKSLKEKREPSELEEDILTTILTYKNLKYMKLNATITSLSGSYSKPFVCLSDDDIKHTLYLQIETMAMMAQLKC